MTRLAALLAALLLVCACPPQRNEDPDPEPVDPHDAIWMVLDQSGSSADVTHTFVSWDGGPGLCSTMQEVYAGISEAWQIYTDAYDAFLEDWSSPDSDDPGYRLAFCQTYEAYYGAFAEALEPTVGLELAYIDLYHPDQTEEGEPFEGTYFVTSLDEEDDEGDDDDGGDDESDPELIASGYWVTHHSNVYRDYVDALDCEAYAADPEAEFPADVDGDTIESDDLVEGQVVLSQPSADAWLVSLLDGVLLSDDGELSDIAFEDSYPRCDVAYEINF